MEPTLFCIHEGGRVDPPVTRTNNNEYGGVLEDHATSHKRFSFK